MSKEKWRWIPPEEWYADLDFETRSKADKLLVILKRYGASEPLSWVSSEMRENIPQVSRFLILREIRGVMDKLPFGDLDTVKESTTPIEKTLNLVELLRDGQASFQRLVESGANVEDILRVSRAVNVQAVLDMVQILDEGYYSSSEDETLGWALVETDNYETTGRFINALHESILDVFEGDDQLQ